MTKAPNAKTLAAIAEMREMQAHPENYKTYSDVDEMFNEILKRWFYRRNGLKKMFVWRKNADL